MDATLNRLKTFAVASRPWFALRPASGRLPLDLVYLIIIAALHHTVLPTLVGHVLLVDLVTPWLVATFVLAPLGRGALIGALGALIVELHSTSPVGLYLCAYWVIAVILRLTRSTLSWRHAFPWAVTFAAAEAWVIGFESFVIGVSEGFARFTLGYVVVQAARLGLAVLIGMLLARPYVFGRAMVEEAA
jgi:hypothetical protein